MRAFRNQTPPPARLDLIDLRSEARPVAIAGRVPLRRDMVLLSLGWKQKCRRGIEEDLPIVNRIDAVRFYGI